MSTDAEIEAAQAVARAEPGSQRTRQRMTFRALIEHIREDYQTNQRDWTMPGFRAVAVYRFGNWVEGLRPWLVRAPFSFTYNALYRYIRNHYTIELPRTAKVGRRFKIGHQGGIVVHWLAKIGDDCVIRQNVTIGAASEATVLEVPELGNRVDVGCGAAILGPVRVGDDVRIGANTVVRSDVPARSTVYPAVPQVLPRKGAWSYSI